MLYTKCVVVFILIANIVVTTGSIYLENDDYNPEYYSYEDFTKIISELSENNSDIFSYESIGETYEGRDIWLVKISDNVEINENEPEVLFTGGMHGNEKIGYQVVIQSIISITENYTSIYVNDSFTNRVRNIVNNTELFFVPMVNPDGCQACTRKNREPNRCLLGKTLFRGVDINRNFEYKWKEFNRHPIKNFILSKYSVITRPFFDFWVINSGSGNGTYRGPHPFSENETIALKNFVENHNIISGIDYHSQGKKILYPWGWTDESADNESDMFSIAENMSGINGFEVMQMCQMYYIFGCFNDWTYANFNTYHFTIELDSVESTPIKESCEEQLMVNLYLAERTISMA